MSDDIIRAVEASVNPDLPQIKPGDMVSVFLRIREGNTERTQEFRGKSALDMMRAIRETFDDSQ